MVVSTTVGHRYRFVSPQEAKAASKDISGWGDDWTAWTTKEGPDWIVAVYDKWLNRLGWIADE